MKVKRIIPGLVALVFLSIRILAASDSIMVKPPGAILLFCEKNYQTNPSLTLLYATTALAKAKQENNELLTGKAYEMIGVSHDFLGNFDSALVYFDASITCLKKQSDPLPYASALKSKANSLYSLSRYKEALSYYVQALNIIKQSGSPIENKKKKEEASLLMGIGNVYSSMGLRQDALGYYFNSLDMFMALKDSTVMSYLYTNIAEEYTALNQVDNKIAYHRKSLALKERLKDDYGLVYSYKNMSEIMTELNKMDSALYYARKAISTSQKIDNTDFLCASYQQLGDVYDKYNNLDSANRYYAQALDLATQMKTLKNQHVALLALARVLRKKGEYRNALDRLFDYLDVHDTLYNADKQRSLQELQMQYETDKKEKEIAILNERDKKTRWMVYSSIVGLVLLGMLSLSLFNRYRLKKRSAHELETRNTLIQHQKELVEEKNKEITDSINYANRIQQALLTGEHYFTEHLGDFFILHQPKDIVSGDFYWALHHHGRFYIATADCTGHGVPGAFMSMLNISYLNEAIVAKNISEPDNILNEVRREVIHALNPHGTTTSSKDGMDCTLCAFDLPAFTVSYAAANNPLWICRNQVITEYQADKMPVGRHDKEDTPFSRHVVQLHKGDIVYTFTDGFADQFGGPKGKKFKYKQLKDTLQQVSALPMAEQKRRLEEVFTQWKGGLEQVDDICIIGIKV